MIGSAGRLGDQESRLPKVKDKQEKQHCRSGGGHGWCNIERVMRQGLADCTRFFGRRRFMVVRRLDELDAEKGNDHPSQNPAAPCAWQVHSKALCPLERRLDWG